MVYGRGSIQQLPELMSLLEARKAFIVTGHSLYTKTDVLAKLESILGDKHVKTFSKIGQHSPIQAIHEAVEEAKLIGPDVIISVGGGSPIDAAKGSHIFFFAFIIVIIHTLQEANGGSFIPQIAIPTTLSVAGMFTVFLG